MERVVLELCEGFPRFDFSPVRKPCGNLLLFFLFSFFLEIKFVDERKKTRKGGTRYLPDRSSGRQGGLSRCGERHEFRFHFWLFRRFRFGVGRPAPSGVARD